MTNTDVIRELSKDVAVLKQQIRQLDQQIEELSRLDTQVALLQQRVDDMREGWKTWGQRLWMLLAPIAGIAVGYYLNKK